MKKTFCDIKGCTEPAQTIILPTGEYHYRACAEDDEGWVQREKDMCWTHLVGYMYKLLSLIPEEQKEEVYKGLYERFKP